ncbi:MAG: hypothetical protein COB02_17855 [Candidatus Cloacimonadota bacterium]|nr:MAG: hypothetical protein COB02_17855 [Candidatus Cloacimonadota bacterium]
MPEIKKEQWLHTGLKLLDKQGRNSLKIITLCEELNLTKGSFYYWFQSKKEFNLDLLKYWRERFTSQFIKQANQGESSKEKLSLLILNCIKTMKDEGRLELEINIWAHQDLEVNKFVKNVYEERFHYLIKLLEDIYPLTNDSKKHGMILYSLMIGVDLFYRKLSRDELYLIFEDYLN